MIEVRRCYKGSEFTMRPRGTAVPFLLIDTGGIEPKTNDTMLRYMRMQTEIAIDMADVIVYMTDCKTGLVADDREIAVMLKRSGKPVIPAVNKVDGVGELPPEFYEFYELGFRIDPIPLSSTHGTGTEIFSMPLWNCFRPRTDKRIGTPALRWR